MAYNIHANVEVIKPHTRSIIFTNTVENDLAIYTLLPTQSIHLGCVPNQESKVRIMHGSTVLHNVMFYDGGAMSNAKLHSDSIVNGVFPTSRGGLGTSNIIVNKLLIGGTSNVWQSSNLHWDDSNSYLGIGTDAPNAALDVIGNIATGGVMRLTSNGQLSNLADLHVTGDATVSNVNASGVITCDGNINANNALQTNGVTRIDASGALKNIVINDPSSVSISTSTITSGTMTVSQGGTGLTYLTPQNLLVGNGSSSFKVTSNVYWNDSNGYLGIGTSNSISELDVIGDIATDNIIRLKRNGTLSNIANIFAFGLSLANGITSLSNTVINGSLKVMDVGTSNTMSTLDVYGDVATDGVVRIARDGSLCNVSISVSNVLGVLSVSQGGTGLSNFENNKFLIASDSNTFSQPDTLYWDPQSNYLGIGTSNPVATLDVNGDLATDGVVRIRKNGTMCNVTLSSIDVKGVLNVSQGGTGLCNLASNRFFVSSDSNTVFQPNTLFWDFTNSYLGMGTTSPASLLDVHGDIATNGQVRLSSNGILSNIHDIFVTGNVNINGMLLSNNTPFTQGVPGFSNDAGNIYILGNSNLLMTTGQMLGSVTGSSNQPAFSWVDDSNTGIYHAGPSQIGITCGGIQMSLFSNNTMITNRLDVTHDIQTGGMTRITNTGTLSNVNIDAALITNGTLSVSRGGTGSSSLTSNKVIVGYGTSPVLTPANLHWNDSSSCLGICTSAPSATLDVMGSASFGGIAGASVIVKSRTSACNNHLIYSDNNTLTFASATDTSFVVIDPNGNLGVGLSNPSYKLHINGDIYATGDITAFSDIRLKTNLERLENCLDLIDKCNGYRFERTDSTRVNSKKYIGLIAQEVELVAPELIYENQEGFKGISYQNMAALFVEAFKEIRKEIQTLKDHVYKLGQHTDITF